MSGEEKSAGTAMRPDVVKKVVAGLLIGVAAIIAVRRIRTYIKGKSEENSLYDAAAYNTRTLSFSEGQAKLYANKLYDAMESTGTDEGMIDEVVAALKTANDWKAVISKFGMRAYGTFGAPVIGSGTPLNLVGWFRRELSGSRLQKILDTLQSYGIDVG